MATKKNNTEIEKTDNGVSSAPSNSNATSSKNDSKDKMLRLKVASKTGKDSYFRCGLQFGKQTKEIEVSEEVASILKKDVWLSVEEIK